MNNQFFFTYGKKPNKPLRRAAQVSKDEIIRLIGEQFSMEFGG